MTRTLETWGASEEVRDWAESVISELVTNAITHGRCRHVLVILLAGNGEFVVVVANDGCPPVRSLTDVDPNLIDGDAECGRGLRIVNAMSSRFGATRGLGRTIVWATHAIEPRARKRTRPTGRGPSPRRMRRGHDPRPDHERPRRRPAVQP
ncbi:ATP-binding protein (plasmid) [Embleya sp. NBC_00888]|nr:ATP-binding protein [Embleya sp. NBC_00888]